MPAPTLLALARDAKQPAAVRQEALIALRFTMADGADKDLLKALVDAAAASDRSLAQTALMTLAAIEVPGTHAPALARLALHPDLSRAQMAIEKLGSLGGKGATETLAKVDSVLENADGILEGVDPATVRTALTNFEQASTTINRAASNVAEVTDTINRRKGEIDQFIADASQLADRLNQASVRVDGVLAKVDGLLGSEDAESLISQASEAIASFREVAETLNSRIGPISDGLARFSGQGLRDVEALVRDSRRAVNRIEQAITDLERNPQRIITGGEGAVRQYDGRARR